MAAEAQEAPATGSKELFVMGSHEAPVTGSKEALDKSILSYRPAYAV